MRRLCQNLPDIASEKRDEAMTRFLSHPRHQLTEVERAAIAVEVSHLLNDPTLCTFLGQNQPRRSAARRAHRGRRRFFGRWTGCACKAMKSG